MPNWEKKPIFLEVGSGGLEFNAAFTGSGFTSGEVGFFVQSTLVNTGNGIVTAESPFFAAKKTSDSTSAGKMSKRTPPINWRTITRLAKKAYSAPVAEVWTAGFDGTDTTKGLAFDCDADYGIRVIAYSPYIRKFYNNQGFVQSYVIHTECCDSCEGCSSADCWTETAKFVKAINETPQAGIPNRFFFAEILLDGSASDIGTGLATTTASLVQGSPIVTFAGNVTIATGAYLRIDPANATDTDDTNPVYKVKVGVTAGTSITLDTPWERASVAALTVTATVSTSAMSVVDTTAVTTCGIQVTGRFLSYATGCCCFPPFPFDFEGVSLLVTRDLANSFPCTWDASQLTSLAYGHGTYKEMLYEEMNALGYTDVRQWFLDCAANIGYSSDLTSTDTYDVYYIEFSNTFPTTPMGGNLNNTPYIVTFAITNSTPGLAGSTSATNMDTVFAGLTTLTGISVT